MAAEHLLATLEQTLRQTRASRARLASRLSDLEQEATALRAEIAEMDTVAAQTEETIYRVMSTVLARPGAALRTTPAPSMAGAYQRQAAGMPAPPPEVSSYGGGGYPAHTGVPLWQEPTPRHMTVPATLPVAAPVSPSHTSVVSVVSEGPAPTVSQPQEQQAEAERERFAERTIPQAVAVLLRDEGGPLHVNDIYQRLLTGGFVFSGHNPTISVATSLSRNSRFRRVAPSTFDLVMREAQAS